MKTSRSLIRQFSLVAGGLLLCTSAGLAAPGNGAAVGAAPASGGHAAASAPAASTAHSPGAAAGGGHPTSNVTGGTFRSSIGMMIGPRPTQGSFTGTARSSGGGYPVGNLNPGQHLGTMHPPATRILPSLPIVNNAWTDPHNFHVAGGTRVGVNGTSNRPNRPTGTTRAGNNLYPGAYGYVPNRPANSQSQHGPRGGEGYHGHHHYYYNTFPYAVYYPYLYNSDGCGGYGAVGNLGYYDGPADYAGLTANSVADLGAPDFSTAANNYYSYTAPEGDTPDQPTATPSQPLPDSPTVGPQSPASPEKAANTPQGPDSLVEAVQTELAQRGYFGGKPDSMYSAATREAIKRFQTDQHLPATGRINEATLHALHLD